MRFFYFILPVTLVYWYNQKQEVAGILNMRRSPMDNNDALQRAKFRKGFWETEALEINDRPFWSNQSWTAVHSSKEKYSKTAS